MHTVRLKKQPQLNLLQGEERPHWFTNRAAVAAAMFGRQGYVDLLLHYNNGLLTPLDPHVAA